MESELRKVNVDAAVSGRVYLVGAGPGDPGLITVRGLELLREAEVVIYDALANESLLAEVPARAELIDAGKRAKQHKLTQDQTNALLYEKAAAGKRVVRLKGGDPYVFARGGEEAIYLHERGIPVEVVPGITSGIAGPAYAGIPITHRHVAVTATFITAHEDPSKPDTQLDYAPLAALTQKGGTLCFYMGVGRIDRIVAELEKYGTDPQTPAAIVQWGTMPEQRSLRTSLHELPGAIERSGIKAPAIIVVGPVAGLEAEAMSWFESRPLFGQTIGITRTRQQASSLRRELELLGARVIESPTIEIVPPNEQTLQEVDAVISEISSFDWLVLTSSNAVDALHDRLDALGCDARQLAGVRVAVIGDATAARLRERLGLRPDLLPERQIGESLANTFIERGEAAGKRFLMLRADIARASLPEVLREAGATVVDLAIYQTRPAASLSDEMLRALASGEIDWLSFTSRSTVTNFIELLGKNRAWLNGVRIASIGPLTSEAIRDAELAVSVEAKKFNVAGLVDALIDAASPVKKSD